MQKGVMKVLGTLGAETKIEAENSERPFNEEMQESLRKGEVIAVCDASVKDGVMGAYWVIMTRKNQTLLSHEMYAKDWSYNTPKTTEAVILLDLIINFTIMSTKCK